MQTMLLKNRRTLTPQMFENCQIVQSITSYCHSANKEAVKNVTLDS